MKYRGFPKIPGSVVSALGFGFMRLPLLQDGRGIDEAKAVELTRLALELGVNYFDTAWPYHDEQSESFLGRALEGLGARERVQIATKSPCWLVNQEGDWERFIDLQLERLRTDRIDYYLFHAVDAARWELIKRLKGVEALERAKAAGKIGHIGFSFHDANPVFKDVLEGYDWEFCQIQYNYYDQDFQAGKRGLDLAASRKVGVIVMEPLRGGSLVRGLPPSAVEAFGSYAKPRTPAEWSLRWILDHPAVVTVLSGMGRPEELLENAAVASSQEAGAMSVEEKAVVARARRAYLEDLAVPCTACRYCMPCPAGVDIPGVFEQRNNAQRDISAGRKPEGARDWYRRTFIEAGKDAGQCVRCGACEPQCPQGIGIMDALAEAHALLTASD